MNPEDLEEAIRLRDGVKTVVTFLRGLREWRGPVALCFGSYQCCLIAPSKELNTDFPSPHERLIEALDMVGHQSLQRLRQLGVDTSEIEMPLP